MARTRRQDDPVLCFRELRDIVLVLSVTFIVLSVAGIIVSILALTEHHRLSVEFMERVNDPDESGHESADLVTWTAVSVLLASCVGLLTSIILLLAARRRRKSLLLPWLVFYGLFFVLLSLLAVICLVVACIAGVWSAIVAAIVQIVAVLVLWSWFGAVFAYHFSLL